MKIGEPLLRSLLSAIDEGIHVVDPRGVSIFYNAAASRLDGLRPEEVLDRPLLDIYPSLNDATSTLLQVLTSGAPILNRQQTVTNCKGHRVTTINSTYPIWVDGQLAGAMEVSKDVTQVRELAESVLDLQAALLRRRRPGSQAPYTFADLLGTHPRFRLVLEQARRAAAGHSSILVAGETGTGKELLIQAIHNASPRSSRPFVVQNCAALPAGLLEGILFGTARGGFTGAEDRPGLFELAAGGSLFLDEINSLPLELQGKLLRVLQDGRVRRVGETRERQVDVRILAATGEDPLAAVATGRLRQDLFHRLNVVFLELPSLRERAADIDLLVNHFLHKLGGSAAPELAADVRELFHRYAWPGNVRELEHALEGALQLCHGVTITLDDLPPPLRRAAGGLGTKGVAVVAHVPLRAHLAATEAEVLAQALRSAGGNVSQAARTLGLPRQTLQYRLRRLGLWPEATG